MIYIIYFILWSFCSASLFCQSSQLELPWLTGPLLAPTPYTLDRGHQNYQPYVYWISRDRMYTQNWDSESIRHLNTLVLTPITKIGVFPRGELDIVPQFYYKNSEGPSDWRIGDWPLQLSYQFVEENKFLNWTWPDVKLRFNVVLPFGQYDKLKPQKYRTDIGGNGSWDPGAALILGKFFHITDLHWIVCRSAFTYLFGTAVSVHGLNTYGGTVATRGRVYPGNLWILNLGLEATLIRRIALACDIEVNHHDKARFTGKSGGLKPQRPSSNLLMVAPAIEYNHSAQLGFIFGPTITFAGRNAEDSIAWVLSMNLRN